MEKKRDFFFLADKKKRQGKEQKQEFKKKQDNEQKQELKKKQGNEQNQEFKKKQHENFDKNRPELIKSDENNDKKPFDKKTYRLKKYSKKYKLDQWEEQRKKKLLREYYKEVKNDPGSGSYKPVSFDEDTVDSFEPGKFVRHPDLINKEISDNQIENNKDPFHKAKERYNKIRQEKLDKKQQIQKEKEEKLKKIQEYKKKKQERFKKLSQKNKKGQPMMTGRLELLLEKIQKG